jgi:hypothetical protein
MGMKLFQILCAFFIQTSAIRFIETNAATRGDI